MALVLHWWRDSAGTERAASEPDAVRVDLDRDPGRRITTLYREASGRWFDVRGGSESWPDVDAYLSTLVDPGGS